MKHTGKLFTAVLWICTILTGLSASAFDGVTNTIPNGASYSGLKIGQNLPNTYIDIESNSTVTVTNYVQLGENSDSTNNTLRVKDGATVRIGTLTTTPTNNGIFIGKADNALIIRNASTVESSALAMGASENEESQINVKGENSRLKITHDAFIGTGADNNQVNIGNGATFEVLGLLTVGATNTQNNAIAVDGESTLKVSSLTNINIAGDNQIIINGTLQADGTVTTSLVGDKNITMNSGSKILVDNTLLGNIDGGYSVVLNESAAWTPLQDEDAQIGFSSSGNSLSFNNSTDFTMTDHALIVGAEFNQNTLNILDDAKLTATEINVGKNGSSNILNIENNAELSMTNGTLIAGKNNLANSNQINLKDEGILTVANLTVGSAGKNNRYIQSGGTATVLGDLTLGEKSSSEGNRISVSGSDAILAINKQLFVGSSTSSNNTVTIFNGGTLFASAQTNIVMGTAKNNTLTVANGGILKTYDWDFDQMTESATNIAFASGSTLHLLGVLSGTNMVEGGMNFVLDGSINGTNATWNTGTNALYVGSTSANNSLTLTNGASASTLKDLYIGTLKNEYKPNSLNVMGGSFLKVGGDAYVGHANTLKIDSTSRVYVNGNYEQGDYAILEIGISSNQVQPNLLVEKNAEFSGMLNTNYPIFKIFNEGVGASNIITIVKAGSITVDGQTATSRDIKANIDTNLLFGFNVTVSNDLDYSYIVLDDFIIHSWKEYLSGQSLDVITEIDSLSNSTAIAMVNILTGMDPKTASKTADSYYGEKMSSTPAHNTINLGLQSVAEQLTKRVDNTRARMSAAHAGMNAPTGAAGPHKKGQELQGWMTGFKSRSGKSADSGFDGYDGDMGGFLIGIDFSVADGILVGVAGGRGTSSIDKDNGASSDTSTSFGSLYASAGASDWFADASFIYGGSSVDTKLGSTFNTTANYDARNIALYFGGGKEIIGKYLIFTPQASLLGNLYSQDAYQETSTEALPRKVDSFDTFYLQSAVGCNVGFYSTVGELTVKPEFRAFWLHEFNAKEEDLAYSLVGVTGSYNMQLQSPESDILKLGGGVSAKLGEYLELRADLDARLASGYSDCTLLGSIRYQF